MDHLTVILTRDRPLGLTRQLNMVLESEGHGSVLVSDNSVKPFNQALNHDLAMNKMVGYVRRNNFSSVFEHIKCCVDECSAEFVLLLHDDDIVDRDLFKVYTAVMQDDPHIDALCGAARINGKDPVDKGWVRAVTVGAQELIDQYTLLRSPFVSVFPFYLFRTRTLKEALARSDDLGIYTDFSVLVELVSVSARIKWINDIVGDYGWHGSNLSSELTITARRKMADKATSLSPNSRTSEHIRSWISAVELIFAIKSRNLAMFLKTSWSLTPRRCIDVAGYIYRIYQMKVYLRQ